MSDKKKIQIGMIVRSERMGKQKQGSNDRYLTGQVNGEKVIMFKNKYKDDNPKAPDFRIYKQKDQEGAVKSAQKQEEPEVDLI